MNYRHAYHAGNASDCVKHALLVWLLHALRRKPAPFTVMDTHAGVGEYDLAGAAAQATGEWREGIGLLWAGAPWGLEAYLALAPEASRYPGSPAIARSLLREDDRLICCELHAEDAAALRRWAAGDRRIAVHRRDGFAALGALLPPATGRGLVLIDPPYEREHEYERVVAGLGTAQRRFGTGVLAAWYPIKHMAPVRELHRRAGAALRDVVAVGCWWRAPLDPGRLNGCGLLVVNPPFGFEAAAGTIVHALLARLGEDGGGFAVERLADE